MKKFLLILSGLVLSLLVVELFLRLKPHTTLNFYDNEIIGSALIPNQKGIFVTESREYQTEVEVNSHGWPDVEHTYEKPEGVYRIVIIGDSFVENWQVPFEERFFRQLEVRLNQDVQKFEVIALGRGNAGTAQQYLMLKNYGLKYRPDLVVHMFFEGNDVQNNSPVLQNDPYLPYFVVNETGSLTEVPHFKRSERSFAKVKEVLKNSRLITFLLSARQRVVEKRNNLRDGYPTSYHVYDENYSDEYRKAWEVTEKLLIETKKITEKSGAGYILVPFPASEQVDTQKQGAILEAYPQMKRANLDFVKPDKILADLCREEKMNCHSMLSAFGHQPSTLYYSRDGHWTKTGTNLVYEVILSIIKALEDKP